MTHETYACVMLGITTAATVWFLVDAHLAHRRTAKVVARMRDDLARLRKHVEETLDP